MKLVGRVQILLIPPLAPMNSRCQPAVDVAWFDFRRKFELGHQGFTNHSIEEAYSSTN